MCRWLWNLCSFACMRQHEAQFHDMGRYMFYPTCFDSVIIIQPHFDSQQRRASIHSWRSQGQASVFIFVTCVSHISSRKKWFCNNSFLSRVFQCVSCTFFEVGNDSPKKRTRLLTSTRLKLISTTFPILTRLIFHGPQQRGLGEHLYDSLTLTASKERHLSGMRCSRHVIFKILIVMLLS